MLEVRRSQIEERGILERRDQIEEKRERRREERGEKMGGRW